MSRYVIGEVEGFCAESGLRSTKNLPGISVVVTDSAYCHRIMGQFRSEDRGRGPGSYIGREGARRAATELAARLEASGGLSR